MVALTLRNVKGSYLTAAEMDANLNDLRYFKVVVDGYSLEITGVEGLTPDSSYNHANITVTTNDDVTINAPSGAPLDMQVLMIKLIAGGTSGNYIWNPIYKPAVGVLLPTAKNITDPIYVTMAYSSGALQWHVLSVLGIE